ncbi:4Fe-4S ferredoxin [Fibrobacter sp. UWB4]|uniref:Coenzyme F420 hydrogenase/dehydrogenase, beta subunit C-terminal domain n=1 Tax=Fibrobacter sp. UWB4 TaxID=1964356 RepID=UPI000B521DE6|nr:4Fe-4S ferredoxin [Fibrobacter sp. UWB4]
MIQITNKEQCCGCNACGDICPKGAISFLQDEEGFWYPKVDLEKCVNCGMCNNVCPLQNMDKVKSAEKLNPPKVVGGFHKNIAIRFDSTSGGIFSALANAMYKDGGYVSGAVQNEDLTVCNFISNDKSDLARLRSSKYVQSSAIGLYKEIKRLLVAGEKVLACGSPCQMGALRSYLGKDYENLIVVDFLCRATNSPKAYRKYMDMLEKQYGGKVVYVKAKNKEHGWHSLARKVVFDNGKEYYGEGHDDHYRRGYHWNMFERPSCYDCKFKEIPRNSDITLGDFWGVEKVAPDLEQNLGTSMVMLNTPKGEAFFEKIRSKLVCREFTVNDILPGNRSALLEPVKYPPIDRNALFKDMDTMPFDEVANKYFPGHTHKVTFKSKIKNLLRFLYHNKKKPFDVLRTLHYCFLNKHVKANILNGDIFTVKSHCAIDLRGSAKIVVNKGAFTFGEKRNFKTKEETALLIEDGGTLQIDGKNFIKTTSDIQIFKNALLRFGPGATNMGLKIVCSEKIWIGDHTRIGRDVWIRDNNGGHKIIQVGYKDKAPVIIGNYVWICSGSQIMKGVTIGDGAVISANSVVTSNVPAHSIVAGNPAKVVAENIYWRP